jgi:hypothetical protein
VTDIIDFEQFRRRVNNTDNNRNVFWRFDKAFRETIPVYPIATQTKDWVKDWIIRAYEVMQEDPELEKITESLLITSLLLNESYMSLFLNSCLFFHQFGPFKWMFTEGEPERDEETIYPVPLVAFRIGDGVSLTFQFHQFDEVLNITDETLVRNDNSDLFKVHFTESGRANAQAIHPEICQNLLNTFRQISLLSNRGYNYREKEEKYVFNLMFPSLPNAATNWTLSFNKACYSLVHIGLN